MTPPTGLAHMLAAAVGVHAAAAGAEESMRGGFAEVFRRDSLATVILSDVAGSNADALSSLAGEFHRVADDYAAALGVDHASAGELDRLCSTIGRAEVVLARGGAVRVDADLDTGVDVIDSDDDAAADHLRRLRELLTGRLDAAAGHRRALRTALDRIGAALDEQVVPRRAAEDGASVPAVSVSAFHVPGVTAAYTPADIDAVSQTVPVPAGVVGWTGPYAATAAGTATPVAAAAGWPGSFGTRAGTGFTTPTPYVLGQGSTGYAAGGYGVPGPGTFAAARPAAFAPQAAYPVSAGYAAPQNAYPVSPGYAAPQPSTPQAAADTSAAPDYSRHDRLVDDLIDRIRGGSPSGDGGDGYVGDEGGEDSSGGDAPARGTEAGFGFNNDLKDAPGEFTVDGWNSADVERFSMRAANPPFMDASYIDEWISNTRPNSPLAGHGADLLAWSDKTGIPVGLALGQWLKESELGTTGNGQGPDFNFGGLTAGTADYFDDGIEYSTRFIRDRQWASFDGNIDAAIGQWFTYVQRRYLDQGVSTYGEFLDIYSPASDGNDHATFEDKMWGTLTSLGYDLSETAPDFDEVIETGQATGSAPAAETTVIIGDSTTEQLRSSLQQRLDDEGVGYVVDAKVGRAIIEGGDGSGIAAIQARKAEVGGPDTAWFIGLGVNDANNIAAGSGVDHAARIDEVMEELADQGPVYWPEVDVGSSASTGYDIAGSAAQFNEALHQAQDRWPNLVVVAWDPDDSAYSDGIHYNSQGVDERVDFIAETIT